MSMETDRIEADLNESRTRLNDTLHELGSKLSPGQMVDEVLGLAQGQAGKLASNLGRQVRDNPRPVLLVAAGIGLLFLNKSRSTSANGGMSESDWETQRTFHSLEEARWNTPRQAGETDEAYEERVHQAYADKLNLKQKAGEAAHEFKARVSHTVEGIRRRAGGLGSRVGRMASSAGSRVGKLATGAGAGVGKLANGAGTGVSKFASGASHFAQDQAHRLGETASNVRHRAEDFYQETPLAAGGIAFAVGALIGGATPLSERERQSLQGIADRAVRTGADLAERGVRMAEERVGGSSSSSGGSDGAVH
jgi:ElaB/YqjD/DUF883 family membrane-anchored ribosome-binding protein